ncbi:hypothetical protein HC246_24790 [Pseudanabaena yagii GIHE-NHR1]|uniref:Uncharacterized protein n=1 Tax=Pseudanabaena yagii GIHE-NHR1 TaxID=2722753 RepID=A0ABX1M1V1_9CYAN|nr:hypothetical protein [Pseudanabaena yagii]NMF61151.1 hypothetical protein [Pseudanabaena yagii GIHE-NHR1]
MAEEMAYQIVSVPLRGNGFETYRAILAQVSTLLVSVPLWGNGFETIKVINVGDYKPSLVSVPLRGNRRES